MTPDFFMTLLLAFIQSATEFLPVSSSAHLVLCQSFGLVDRGVFSDVALHAGTLIAVIIYFRKDLMRMLKSLYTCDENIILVRNLIIATVPAMIGGIVGVEVISRLRSPVIIAGTSIVFGALLWVTDKISFAGTNSDLRTMTIWDALCIGLAQVLSLVPGVSRSGISITCCRALGFSRRESTRFSMLLSVPTISAAAVYLFYLVAKENMWNRILTSDIILGSILSAVLGLAVITFLMNWVKRASFAVFAIYRILLGLFVVYYFFF